MDSICRICTNIKRPMRSLFETDSDLIEFHVKLYICFPTINTDDTDFPTTICYACVKKLQNAYKFRELCVKSTRIFTRNRENKRKNRLTVYTTPIVIYNAEKKENDQQAILDVPVVCPVNTAINYDKSIIPIPLASSQSDLNKVHSLSDNEIDTNIDNMTIYETEKGDNLKSMSTDLVIQQLYENVSSETNLETSIPVNDKLEFMEGISNKHCETNEEQNDLNQKSLKHAPLNLDQPLNSVENSNDSTNNNVGKKISDSDHIKIISGDSKIDVPETDKQNCKENLEKIFSKIPEKLYILNDLNNFDMIMEKNKVIQNRVECLKKPEHTKENDVESSKMEIEDKSESRDANKSNPSELKNKTRPSEIFVENLDNTKEIFVTEVEIELQDQNQLETNLPKPLSEVISNPIPILELKTNTTTSQNEICLTDTDKEKMITETKPLVKSKLNHLLIPIPISKLISNTNNQNMEIITNNNPIEDEVDTFVNKNITEIYDSSTLNDHNYAKNIHEIGMQILANKKYNKILSKNKKAKQNISILKKSINIKRLNSSKNTSDPLNIKENSRTSVLKNNLFQTKKSLKEIKDELTESKLLQLNDDKQFKKKPKKEITEKITKIKKTQLPNFTSMKLSEVKNDADLEYPYVCDLCNMRMQTMGQLAVHLTLHVDDKKDIPSTPKNKRQPSNETKSITCKYCERTFNTQVGYKLHQVRMHKDVQDTQVSGQLLKLSYICAVCQKVFPSKNSWYRHRKSHSFERKQRKILPKIE